MIGLAHKMLSTSKQLHLLIVLGCLATIPGCSCSRDRDIASSTEQEAKEQETKESEKSTESDKAENTSGNQQQESPTASGSKDESSTNEGSAGNSDSTSSESNSASPPATQSSSPAAGKSTSNHAGGGFGSVPQSKSSAPNGNNSERTTPVQALAKAEKLSGSAETHANKGNYAKAYAASLEAWQSLQSHPGDKACQAVAGELMVAMKRYGERTNRSNVQAIKDASRKPLRVE